MQHFANPRDGLRQDGSLVVTIDMDGVFEGSLYQDQHGSLRFASVIQMRQI